MDIKKIVITITTAAGLGAGIEYGVTPENLDPLYTYKPVAKTQKVLVAGVDLSRDDRLRASTKLEIFTFLKQYTHFTENSEVNSYNIRTGKCKSEWQGQYIESVPIGVNEKFNVEITEYEIKYIGLWDSTDVVVRTVPNGLKETIVLKDKYSPITFEWNVKSNVTDVERIIKPPTAYDAVGKVVPVDGRYINGSYYIDIDVTSAEFPVTIDPTVEWQPGATSGKDTYVNKTDPTKNYGITASLKVASLSTAITHSLLQFDSLSVISVGMVIDSAFLILTANSNFNTISDSTMSLHYLTRQWTEGTVNNAAGVCNWDTASTGIKWTTAGGDYNVTKYGTKTMSDTILQYSTLKLNVKDLVNLIVNSAITNYGWIIKWDTEGAADFTFSFFSSDYTTTNTYRPKLVVYYSIPLTAPYSVSISGVTSSSFTISATDSNKSRKGLYLYRKGGAKLDSVLAPGSTQLYTWTVIHSSYTPNVADSFYVAVYDSVSPPDTTRQIGSLKKYTAASVPIVELTDTSSTSLTITVGSDGNPSTVRYAVKDTAAGKYLTSSGTLTTSLTWFARSYLVTGITRSSLNPNYAYGMIPYALNSDSVATSAGDSLLVWTWAVVPDKPTVTKYDSVHIRVKVSPLTNPGYTYFALQDSITGKYYDLTNLTFRSTGVTTDSSWAWYTYSQWGGASGKLLTVAKGTRYVLRMYSKEGRE
jgi:hypothetical protein